MLPIVSVLVALFLLGAQRVPPPPPEGKPDVVLPSGKSQKREILKSDFEKSKTEAGELLERAQELKDDFDKSDPYVLDLRTLKKAEEIEKLARRIKDRMKRHM